MTDAQFGQPAPFVELIDWACQQLDTRQLDLDRIMQHAQAVAQHHALLGQIGGFEYHHDGSGRVDFSLQCDPRQTTFGTGMTIPHWMHALLSPITGTAAMSATSIQPTQPTLSLPAIQWIELDQLDQRLTLAGIWQRVHRPAEMTTATAIAQLAERLAVTPLDQCAIKQSRRLATFADLVGFPTQIGIMTGRADGLKALAAVDPARPQPIRDFLQHPDFVDAFTGCDGIERIIDGLSALTGFNVAFNVDINLADDRLTGIGIELAPTDHGRSNLNASVLRLLTDGFALPSIQIKDSAAVISPLPRVTRRRRHCSAFARLLRPDLEQRLLIARFSHLKVVLRPATRPMLKTYVALIVRWGRDAETASTSGNAPPAE